MNNPVISRLNWLSFFIKNSDIPIFLIQYLLSWILLSTMTYQINATHDGVGASLLFLRRPCGRDEVFSGNSTGGFLIKNSTCVDTDFVGLPVYSINKPLEPIDHVFLFFAFLLGICVKGFCIIAEKEKNADFFGKFLVKIFSQAYFSIMAWILMKSFFQKRGDGLYRGLYQMDPSCSTTVYCQKFSFAVGVMETIMAALFVCASQPALMIFFMLFVGAGVLIAYTVLAMLNEQYLSITGLDLSSMRDFIAIDQWCLPEFYANPNLGIALFYVVTLLRFSLFPLMRQCLKHINKCQHSPPRDNVAANFDDIHVVNVAEGRGLELEQKPEGGIQGQQQGANPQRFMAPPPAERRADLLIYANAYRR